MTSLTTEGWVVSMGRVCTFSLSSFSSSYRAGPLILTALVEAYRDVSSKNPSGRLEQGSAAYDPWPKCGSTWLCTARGFVTGQTRNRTQAAHRSKVNALETRAGRKRRMFYPGSRKPGEMAD